MKSRHLDALLIFDCDGVLVDSEPLANRVLHDSLRRLGLDISLEHSTSTFTGLSMKSCVALVENMLGAPVPDDFVPELRRRTTLAFRDQLRPVEGVDSLLGRSLQRGDGAPALVPRRDDLQCR